MKGGLDESTPSSRVCPNNSYTRSREAHAGDLHRGDSRAAPEVLRGSHPLHLRGGFAMPHEPLNTAVVAPARSILLPASFAGCGALLAILLVALIGCGT